MSLHIIRRPALALLRNVTRATTARPAAANGHERTELGVQRVEIVIETLPLLGDLFPDLRNSGVSDTALERLQRPGGLLECLRWRRRRRLANEAHCQECGDCRGEEQDSRDDQQ